MYPWGYLCNVVDARLFPAAHIGPSLSKREGPSTLGQPLALSSGA